ncbi:MAG: hypothetical protein ACYC6Z_10160 [Thermoleophilia bacterium]
MALFDYLYYKFYRAGLRSSLKEMPAFVAAVTFGGVIGLNIIVGVIGLNIIVVSLLIARLKIAPLIFPNKYWGGVLNIAIAILASIYYSGERRQKVIDKYSKETEKLRKRGNLLVKIYVVVSFLSIYAVAFIGPSKL